MWWKTKVNKLRPTLCSCDPAPLCSVRMGPRNVEWIQTEMQCLRGPRSTFYPVKVPESLSFCFSRVFVAEKPSNAGEPKLADALKYEPRLRYRVIGVHSSFVGISEIWWAHAVWCRVDFEDTAGERGRVSLKHGYDKIFRSTVWPEVSSRACLNNTGLIRLPRAVFPSSRAANTETVAWICFKETRALFWCQKAIFECCWGCWSTTSFRTDEGLRT